MRYWIWTNLDENMFTLSPEALYTFKLLVHEAEKETLTMP